MLDPYKFHVEQWNNEQAVAQEQQRLSYAMSRLQWMRLVNWGHLFGDNRQCDCGLHWVNFYLDQPRKRLMCPNFYGQALVIHE
jgi:hypothetical protein